MPSNFGNAVKDVWSSLRTPSVDYQQVSQSPWPSDTLEQGIDNSTEDEKTTAAAAEALPPRPPRWYWCLLPFPIAAALGKTTRRLPKTSSTSYLNGIRGIACVIVFTFHVNQRYYRDFNYPYGAEGRNYVFGQLPLIRIMYAGKGMVAIFFVLSGFVLAYSPLRKIKSLSPPKPEVCLAEEYGNSPAICLSGPLIATKTTTAASELITGLCSSILRRGIRLFTPMIVVAMMTCLVTWNYPTFWPLNWRDGNPTFLQHVWRYVGITAPTLNPFRWDIYHPISFNQCWTLPVEYRGSMVVFLMCIATARLSTRARKFAVLALAVSALYVTRGDMFCFLAGMFLAELRHSPLTEDLRLLARVPQRVTRVLAVCVLIPSLLVMGWPEFGDGGIEPYRTLAQLVPSAWKGDNEMITFFWAYLTAPFVLAALENLPAVQRVLTVRPILYLGEISYSFYLLHWMVYLCPGWEMMVFLKERSGWPLDTAFYVMFILTFSLLAVVSDYFWRLVDENSVKLGKIFVDWLGVHNDS